MNHPLTEKILEEFDKEFVKKLVCNECNTDDRAIKAFLLSAIKRTANEFRVEEKKVEIELPDTLHRNVGYNQCASEINAKVDEFNPTQE